MSGRSRARTLAFASATLALAALGIELLSVGIHAVVFGGLPSPARAEEARRALWSAPDPVPSPLPDRAPGEQDENNIQALHPYLGYVLDPLASRTWPVNAYGFLGDPPPFATDPAATAPVSIAIVGGSVAENMTIFANETLQRELRRVEAFRGRDLRITCLALRGMKQPQQLLTIDWFLSLGARFDVVINLDGFNEVVLAGENAMQGTFPFYPRRWKIRMRGLPDAELVGQAGRVRVLEALRIGAARRVSASIARHTATGNLIWKLVDRQLAARVQHARATLNEALLADDTSESAYEAVGPPVHYDDDLSRARALAAYWRRASALLHERATSHGFRYFHFLQPNQHVPNSKPFGAAERAIALPGNYFFRDAARTGYAELIAAGSSLAAAGVPFTDLTMLFEDTAEPLYADPCCHFTRSGYERIAEAVARTVREAYARGAAD